MWTLFAVVAVLSIAFAFAAWYQQHGGNHSLKT
jgi:hypothetical protein